MTSDKAYDFDDADIVLRTPRSRGFRVHKSVLSVASPVLRALVADASKPPPKDEEGDALPEVDVDDAPEDLDLLLRLIYPITYPPKSHVDFEGLRKTSSTSALQHLESAAPPLWRCRDSSEARATPTASQSTSPVRLAHADPMSKVNQTLMDRMKVGCRMIKRVGTIDCAVTPRFLLNTCFDIPVLLDPDKFLTSSANEFIMSDSSTSARNFVTQLLHTREVDVENAPEGLDLLLRLIYPITYPPKFEDFDTLSRAFAILQKYKIEGVQGLLKPILVSSSFLASDPVRVYAMACRLGFKEEIEVAAPLAATIDFTTTIRAEDLRQMSGVDYHRFVVLSKERFKRSKSDIFFLLQCPSCPQNFYDLFRKKLAEKLNTDDGSKFYDTVECLEVCFTVSKECGGYNCPGVGGNVHFEKFVFGLVKELQKPPACVY
ncbi:hypothetical protein BDM02DRAFT_3130769 [Thelephora ganbajun]|uniref:Uncharacterized protein n=1 Tax=Thelephora ganbajun TaxID=370292 RepID=A0ACB6Z806_THEGA|nr:hypothetical protein BDM02DRAFT_3130769 [Thelephora ganbajun]